MGVSPYVYTSLSSLEGTSRSMCPTLAHGTLLRYPHGYHLEAPGLPEKSCYFSGIPLSSLVPEWTFLPFTRHSSTHI